ncbi:MAG: hypothetical protein J7513_11510 [Solirubrobacteraceae bacterium]|nr:hypothetical protein [Solirubrobacteraceae bacterium]
MQFTKNLFLAGAMASMAVGAGAIAATAGPTDPATAAAPIASLERAATADVSPRIATLAKLDALEEWSPSVTGAKSIKAGSESWTVLAGRNGSLCANFGEDALTCAYPDRVRRGDFALTQIAPPTGAAAEALAAAARGEVTQAELANLEVPAMPAVRRAIVADGAVTARALDAKGNELHSTKVIGNTYTLPLGREGEAERVELLDGTGRILASVAAF